MGVASELKNAGLEGQVDSRLWASRASMSGELRASVSDKHRAGWENSLAGRSEYGG